jgi:hypothetical protein
MHTIASTQRMLVIGVAEELAFTQLCITDHASGEVIVPELHIFFESREVAAGDVASLEIALGLAECGQLNGRAKAIAQVERWELWRERSDPCGCDGIGFVGEVSRCPIG